MYRNYKIPVHQYLVEGPQSSKDIRRKCAQYMIDAIAHLYNAKPSDSNAKVTCVIARPDMFSSELCIYFDTAYLQSFLRERNDAYGNRTKISHRSLSQELGLRVPPEFNEIGFSIKYQSVDDIDPWEYTSEHWYFGELS